MKDGTIYEGQTSAPKGSSDKPLTAGELKDKFKVTSGLSPDRAEKVIERVMELEKVESASEILSLIRPE
jgi:2-methylcitrate dehydratase PrpD